MLSYIIVGLGGFFGAIARILLMSCMPTLVMGVPAKIMTVNAVGCLLIGIVLSLIQNIFDSASLRHFLVQGFLGGFTTFSAFALEVGLIYERGQLFFTLLYIVLTLIVCMALFFLGLKGTDHFFS